MINAFRLTGAGSVACSLAGGLAVATQLAALLHPDEALAGACRPRRPLPAITLKSMGPCNFNAGTLSFAGTAVEQAACLIRPVNPWAHFGPPLEPLPKGLAARIGGSVPVPNRAMLPAVINATGLPPQFINGLNEGVSRARDGDELAPMARYFVIHDTSGPRFASFPANLDENTKINNLERFSCSDAAEIAHAFVNRQGNVYVGHDFGVPWRATKFERALSFGSDLKGLFLHVELIQPRRRGGRRGGNDIAAPTPGFSAAQYQRLALLYTIASVRAGAWLVPAYHAVIDGDIRGGHDDPQHFEVEAFALALDGVMEQLAALNGQGGGQGGE
jgi:N-acetylmuramoyl-L-alanine amidase